MAVNNTITITYGTTEVGGLSDSYQLHGPYGLDKDFDKMRMTFELVVVGLDDNDLQAKMLVIEDAFRERDLGLTIDINGAAFTYTSGTTILNVKSSLSKSADVRIDQGLSRGYTLVVEGELPGDATTGLRDYDVDVSFEAGKQRVVTMAGTYTANSSGLAASRYIANWDAEALTILTALKAAATWELVDENYARGRNDHVCEFKRQYVEVLQAQSQLGLTVGIDTETQIVDARIVFTDTSQHPGDSRPGIYRLRRVVANFDCAVNIDVTTNLQSVYENKIRPHLIALFQSNFTPSVFSLDDPRLGYDESTKRMSISLTFIYQSGEGGGIVEVSQSIAFREARTVDATPVHLDDELAYEIDPGFATVERVASRTVVVVGTESPRRRIGVDSGSGPAGRIKGIEGGKNVSTSGWNIMTSTSQVTDQWVGDPTGGQDQIRLAILTESVVERLTKAPAGRDKVKF